MAADALSSYSRRLTLEKLEQRVLLAATLSANEWTWFDLNDDGTANQGDLYVGNAAGAGTTGDVNITGGNPGDPNLEGVTISIEEGARLFTNGPLDQASVEQSTGNTAQIHHDGLNVNLDQDAVDPSKIDPADDPPFEDPDDFSVVGGTITGNETGFSASSYVQGGGPQFLRDDTTQFGAPITESLGNIILDDVGDPDEEYQIFSYFDTSVDVTITADMSATLRVEAGNIGILEVKDESDILGPAEILVLSTEDGGGQVTDFTATGDVGEFDDPSTIIADHVANFTVSGNILPDSAGTAAVQILPDIGTLQVDGYANNVWVWGGPDSATFNSGVNYLTIGGYEEGATPGEDPTPLWDVGTLTINGSDDLGAYTEAVGSQVWLWGDVDTLDVNNFSGTFNRSGLIFVDGEVATSVNVAEWSESIHVGGLAPDADMTVGTTTGGLFDDAYIYLAGAASDVGPDPAEAPRPGRRILDETNEISVQNQQFRLFSRDSLGIGRILTGNINPTDITWDPSDLFDPDPNDSHTWLSNFDQIFEVAPESNPGYTDDIDITVGVTSNDQHVDANPRDDAGFDDLGADWDWDTFTDGIYANYYYRGSTIAPDAELYKSSPDDPGQYLQQFLTVKDAEFPYVGGHTEQLPLVEFEIDQGRLLDVTIDVDRDDLGVHPGDAAGLEVSSSLRNSVHVIGNLSFLFVHGTAEGPGNIIGSSQMAATGMDIVEADDPNGDTRQWSVLVETNHNGHGSLTGARVEHYTSLETAYNPAGDDPRHVTVDRDRPYDDQDPDTGIHGVELGDTGFRSLSHIMGIYARAGRIGNVYVQGDAAGDVVSDFGGIDLLVVDADSTGDPTENANPPAHPHQREGLYSTVRARGELGDIRRLRADHADAYMFADLQGAGAHILAGGALGIAENRSTYDGPLTNPESDWAIWIGDTTSDFVDGTVEQDGSGYVRRIQGSSDGVRTRIHGEMNDVWTIEIDGDQGFGQEDRIDLPYDNGLFLQVKGELSWDPNARNEFGNEGNQNIPVNNHVLIGEERSGENQGLADGDRDVDGQPREFDWTMSNTQALVVRQFQVRGDYSHNLFFFNEGDNDAAAGVQTYDNDDERIEYIEYVAQGGNAMVQHRFYKGLIDQIKFVDAPGGGADAAVHVTTRVDVPFEEGAFNFDGEILGAGSSLLTVVTDYHLGSARVANDNDIIGVPFGLVVPDDAVDWDPNDPARDDGFLEFDAAGQFVDWDGDGSTTDPTAVLQRRGFIREVLTGVGNDLTGDVVSLSGLSIQLVDVTGAIGDTDDDQIDIYSVGDIEDVQIDDSVGTVNVYAGGEDGIGGTIGTVNTAGDIGKVRGSTYEVNTLLQAGGTIGLTPAGEPLIVEITRGLWEDGDLLDSDASSDVFMTSGDGFLGGTVNVVLRGGLADGSRTYPLRNIRRVGLGRYFYVSPDYASVSRTSRNAAFAEVSLTDEALLAVAETGADDVEVFTSLPAAFHTGTTNDAPAGVAFGDINGDGFTDIVASNSADNNLSLFLFDQASGTFGPDTTIDPDPILPVATPVELALGDLDGKNGLDIVTVNENSDNVWLLFNDGTGGFSQQATWAVGAAGAAPASLTLADVNVEDGLDIVTANSGDNDVTVLLNNGIGTSFERFNYTLDGGTTPVSVAAGDVDGLNGPDLVTANQGSGDVTLLVNDGDLGFDATAMGLGPAGDPVAVAFADVDGETRDDILTAVDDAPGNDDSVSVLINDGAGNFGSEVIVSLGVDADPARLDTGDFDADLDTDFILTLQNGDVDAHLNNGAGQFPDVQNVAAGLGLDEDSGLDFAPNRDELDLTFEPTGGVLHRLLVDEADPAGSEDFAGPPPNVNRRLSVETNELLGALLVNSSPEATDTEPVGLEKLMVGSANVFVGMHEYASADFDGEAGVDIDFDTSNYSMADPEDETVNLQFDLSDYLFASDFDQTTDTWDTGLGFNQLYYRTLDPASVPTNRSVPFDINKPGDPDADVGLLMSMTFDAFDQPAGDALGHLVQLTLNDGSAPGDPAPEVGLPAADFTATDIVSDLNLRVINSEDQSLGGGLASLTINNDFDGEFLVTDGSGPVTITGQLGATLEADEFTGDIQVGSMAPVPEARIQATGNTTDGDMQNVTIGSSLMLPISGTNHAEPRIEAAGSIGDIDIDGFVHIPDVPGTTHRIILAGEEIGDVTVQANTLTGAYGFLSETDDPAIQAGTNLGVLTVQDGDLRGSLQGMNPPDSRINGVNVPNGLIEWLQLTDLKLENTASGQWADLTANQIGELIIGGIADGDIRSDTSIGRVEFDGFTGERKSVLSADAGGITEVLLHDSLDTSQGRIAAGDGSIGTATFEGSLTGGESPGDDAILTATDGMGVIAVEGVAGGTVGPVDLSGRYDAGGQSIDEFDLDLAPGGEVDNIGPMRIQGGLGSGGFDASGLDLDETFVMSGQVAGDILANTISDMSLGSLVSGGRVETTEWIGSLAFSGEVSGGTIRANGNNPADSDRAISSLVISDDDAVAAGMSGGSVEAPAGGIGGMTIEGDVTGGQVRADDDTGLGVIEDVDIVGNVNVPFNTGDPSTRLLVAEDSIGPVLIDGDVTLAWLQAAQTADGEVGDGTADFTGGVQVTGVTTNLLLDGDLVGASPAFESGDDVDRVTITGDLTGDDDPATPDVLVDGDLGGMRVEGALLTDGAVPFRMEADDIGRLFVQEQLTPDENLVVDVPWMYFASPTLPDPNWTVDLSAPAFRSNPLTVSLDLDDFSLVDNFHQDGSNRFYYWHDGSTNRRADIVYDLDDGVANHSLTADFELDEVEPADQDQQLLSVTFSALNGVDLASVRPTVDTFTVNIEPTAGDDPAEDVELVATTSDLDGSVSQVEFYRDVDDNDVLDTGVDVLLGVDSDPADDWKIFSTTGDWDAGSNTLFARAEDDQTVRSLPASTDVTTSQQTDAPDLVIGDDTGNDNADDLTNEDEELTFDVASTLAGATVNLYVDGVLRGSEAGVAGGITQVSMAAGFSLSDGTHQVMARQILAGEAESPNSAELTIEVDTVAPNVPGAPDMQAGSDSGISDSDEITNDATPTFDIFGVTDFFRVYADNGMVNTQISGAYEGASPFTPGSGLADNDYDVTVTGVDAAGNESAPSNALPITIDTTDPAAPAAPDLQAGSDSGAFDDDDITNDDTPTFTVTTLPELYFRIYRDGSLVSEPPVAGDDGGVYRDGEIETLTAQAEGTYDFTARHVDAAGNESASSGALEVSVDITGPVVTDVDPDGTVASTVSSIDVDYLDTNGHGMWVSTVQNTANYGLLSSGGDGTFGDGNELNHDGRIQDPVAYAAGGGGTGTATIGLDPELTDGRYQLTIVGTTTVRDLAGNPLNDGSDETSEFTVDAETPSVTVDLQPLSDTGQFDDDELTRAQNPIFDVTVNEPGLVNIDWEGDGTMDIVGFAIPAAGTTAFTATGLAEGVQPIEVTFTDVAGNVDTAGLPTTVDRTGPIVEAVDPDLGATTDVIDAIDVDFLDINPMDDTTVADTANYVLVASGGDGTFADGNETDLSHLIGSVDYSEVPDQMATLNLSEPLPDDRYQLTVIGTTTVLDGAGNALNDGADEVRTFIVDTDGMPAVSVDLQPGSDSGEADDDDITNAISLTYDVTVDEVGMVEIDWEDDGTVDESRVLDDTDIVHSFTVDDPAEGVLPVEVTYTDTAGNVQNADLPTIVDRTGPTVEAVIPSGVTEDVIDQIEVDFTDPNPDLPDPNPLWVDTVTEAANYVLMSSGGDGTFGDGNEQDLSGLILPPLPYDGGTQTVTLPLSQSLSDEAYQLTVVGTATVRDAAGNALNDGADESASFTVDTAGPPTVTIDLQASSDSGVLDDDDLTNAMNPVFDIEVSEPGTIQIDWEGDGIVDETDSLTAAGIYQFTAFGLGEGEQQIEVDFTDLASNTTEANLPTEIDRTAPAVPGAPDLQPGSDSGVDPTDDITGFTALDFDLASTDDFFRFYTDGARVSGEFEAGTTFGVSGQTEGVHNYQVSGVDAAGNESGQSPTLPVTLDLSAPAVPVAPDLQPGSDSGISNSDDITNVSSPTFDVSPAEMFFRFYRSGALVSSTFETGGTFTAAGEPEGNWNYTVSSVDVAGNESAASGALGVMLDFTAPAAPAAPDLLPGSDAMDETNNATDNRTTDPTPEFGVTTPADHFFRLYRDGTLVSVPPITGDDGAVYKAGASEELPDQPRGTFDFTAGIVDRAGNESAPSAPLEVELTGLWLLARREVEDGVFVSFYDADPQAGADVIDPGIAWNWGEFNPGTDQIVVDPGAPGDEVIDQILLLGPGSETEDLGILIEGNDRVWSVVDARSSGSPTGFVVSEGHIGFLLMTDRMIGGQLNTLEMQTDWNLPLDPDGDGSETDRTAIFTSGSLDDAIILDDLAGDAVVDDDVNNSLQVIGGDVMGEIGIGGDANLLLAVDTGAGGGTFAANVEVDGTLNVMQAIGGDIAGDFLEVGQDLNFLQTVHGDIESAINVGTNAGTILSIGASPGGDINGPVDVHGRMDALVAVNGHLRGDVDVGGSLDTVYVGRNMTGDLSVGGTMGTVRVDRNVSGSHIQVRRDFNDLSIGDSLDNSLVEVGRNLHNAFIQNDLDNSSLDANPLGVVFVGGRIRQDDTDGDQDFLASREPFWLGRPTAFNLIDEDMDGDDINGVELQIGV